MYDFYNKFPRPTATPEGTKTTLSDSVNIAIINPTLFSMTEEWLASGNGFGTCVVLEAPIDMIEGIQSTQYLPSNSLTGVVVDTSYPIPDGSVTHLVSLTTCAYIFGYKEELEHVLGNLNLYP